MKQPKMTRKGRRESSRERERVQNAIATAALAFLGSDYETQEAMHYSIQALEEQIAVAQRYHHE